MKSERNSADEAGLLTEKYYGAYRRFLLPAVVIMALVGYLLWYLLGAASLLVIIPLGMGILLLLHLETVRQVARIIRRHHHYCLVQTQAIHSLYAVLKPDLPLPPLTRWTVGPDFAQVIVTQILTRRPATVLELGSGTSTVIIGLALRKAGGGRVLSLEHDEVYATRTSESLALYDLGDFTRVIHSPLEEISIGKASHLWYDLSVLEEGLPRIDMLIIDGPPGKTQPQARYPALPLLADRLHEEAVILLDDGKRHDEKLIVQRWSEDHPGLMALKIDTEKGAFMIQKVGGGPPQMSSPDSLTAGNSRKEDCCYKMCPVFKDGRWRLKVHCLPTPDSQV